MRKSDFGGAYAKLARARKHINDVDAQITVFLSTNFYRLRLEPDERKTSVKVILESLHQPDQGINTIIGDAVGNLRSVLDYAAVAILAPIIEKTDGIYFVFADNDKDYAARIQKTYSGFPAAVSKHFIDKVQAYNKGTGHDLWVINNLRNIDKHRLLVTITQLAGFTADFKLGTNIFTNCSVLVSAGEKGVAISAPVGQFDFTNQPRPTFDIQFNEPRYISNVSVSSFLHGAFSQIESLLKAFEVVF